MNKNWPCRSILFCRFVLCIMNDLRWLFFAKCKFNGRWFGANKVKIFTTKMALQSFAIRIIVLRFYILVTLKRQLMVFTEIDKKTMQILCTLAKLAGPAGEKRDAIVNIGQFLGVPKDDTLELLEEWEEYDIMHLASEEEKRHFVNYCFSYMNKDYHPKKSEREFYQQVVNNLGLTARFDN